MPATIDLVDLNKFPWELPPPRDIYLNLSIRRSTLYAFVASLLIHLLALFAVPQLHMNNGELLARAGDPLTVSLQPRASAPNPQNPSAAILETPPQSQADHRRKAAPPPVLALRKPRPDDLARPANPLTPSVPSPAAEAAPDMLAYINAARARRQAAEGIAGRENAEAAGDQHEPTEDEIRMARVKRNLNPGTNGVFQILSIESRTAAFSFRGWTTDAGNSRREYIQVELGTNSNIEIAIVRKMIELIRRYYKGDFNWESQRLDRVVTLSARAEDNTGLEDFLMQEFFASRSRPADLR
ncbi:MAG: hypothetical protein HY066_06315 [Betaproteobacteria bacterium]|nr:hypothetical protein [Betaproteobacteria bacterium]